MSHILDNPIYHALITNHRLFSDGSEEVRHYHREVASFAGMKNYSAADFEELYTQLPDEGVFIIFSPDVLEIPKPWKQVAQIEMFQFVYHYNFVPELKKDVILTDLDKQHVSEMMALVELTKPGPFLSRTIDLSNYTGVLENGRLAAMAGHRFHPGDYIEV